MLNNFIDSLKALIINILVEKVNTCIPGIVESYDASKKRAIVTPAISKAYVNNKFVNYTPIVNVPIMFPKTKNTAITFPLEKGDRVLIVFSQRAIGNFLEKGILVNPENNNTFDSTDAFAFPSISFDGDIVGSDNEALEICHYDERITIKKDGEIQLGKDSLKKLVNETFTTLFDEHIHGPGTYTTPSGGNVTMNSGAPTVLSNSSHLTSIVKGK